jgi:general secretion pathway protein K
MKFILGQHTQRGVALIIVLWVVTLLTVVALSFAQTMRTDVNVVSNSLARVKAETLVDAATERAIFELFKPQNLDGRWNADGSSREWSYRDLNVVVTMQDETGKIDINRANEQLMRGLLRSQGLTEDEAAKLNDAIIDWRDADTLRRPNGAEAPEYTAAGLNYTPANAPFQAVEELKLVLGMTPDLYTRIAPLITIYSAVPGINDQVATRDVLRALPNVNDQLIDEYIARRDLARANRQPIPTFPQNLFRSVSNNATPTRIRTDVTFPDGNRFIREVVVRRYNDGKRPYAFLSWKEGRDLQGSEALNPDGSPALAAVGTSAQAASAAATPVANAYGK